MRAIGVRGILACREAGARPGEAVDLGRAAATGRVFPLYTCQKKPVIQ